MRLITVSIRLPGPHADRRSGRPRPGGGRAGLARPCASNFWASGPVRSGCGFSSRRCAAWAGTLCSSKRLLTTHAAPISFASHPVGTCRVALEDLFSVQLAERLHVLGLALSMQSTRLSAIHQFPGSAGPFLLLPSPAAPLARTLEEELDPSPGTSSGCVAPRARALSLVQGRRG